MAKALTALADLKSAFGDFGDTSIKIDEMNTKIDEINQYNVDAAGHDDLGTTYHGQIDAPTKTLTTLLKHVRDAVNSAGQQGQNASASLDAADQDNKDSV